MEDKNTPTKVSLQSLLVPNKTLELEYPGSPEFKVQLNYISREQLMNIRKKASKTKYNAKTRVMDEQLDEEAFLRLYTDAVIKGWKGFTVSILEKLCIVNTQGVNKDSLVDYTPEDAFYLMKNSSEFDAWVSDTLGDLSNFQKTSSK